jgi:hypothetical protein
MEPQYIGYKDPELNELADEVRKGRYRLMKVENGEEWYKLKNIINQKSAILAKYLRDTYPNLFNAYTFKAHVPNFVLNSKYKLNSAPKEIVEIWDYVKNRYHYKPKLHDFIYIFSYLKTSHCNAGLRLFVDEDDVYIIYTNWGFPDEFYNFLELMGLDESYSEYLYNSNHIESLGNKWPFVVSKIKEKL